MAHQTVVNHYDLTALDLLAGSENFLCRIAKGATGEPTLNIPFWQRDYDWGTEQIDNFLMSVHEAAQSRTDLYLGTLVFGIHSEHPSKILVIDGQQRLRSIQNLLIRSRVFFQDDEHGAVLSLVHGLGDAETPVQTDDAVEKSFSSVKQSTAFSEWYLRKREFDKVLPEEWLPRLRFRAVVTRFKRDRRFVEDPFDVVMSNLFANVNRQAKPLDDIDVVKAKLLFGLRNTRYEDETEAEVEAKAEEFAREWETARMLQLVPTQWADRALLETDVLDDEAEKVLTAVPYDPETIRLQFSRYLLLVKAYAEGEVRPIDVDMKTIVEDGVFGKKFGGLCQSTNRNELLAFAGALKTVNDLFLANRDFLLLARRNRVEVKEEGKEARERPPLTAARNRLLLFQGFVSGGTTRASWLSERALLRLLQELSRCRHVDEDELDAILVKLESELFADLESPESERSALTARDWFLWRALFDDVGNPVYELAVKGCEKMLEAAGGNFTAGSGEELLQSLRENVSAMTTQELPTVTGAAEVEHWVAFERGRKKDEKLEEMLNRLSNKAHIAEGLNQSMRNDGILKKAGNRDGSWWPTLQFLAAYSVCGNRWGVVANPMSKRNLRAFLEPLDQFWETVSEPYKTEMDKAREVAEMLKSDQEEVV